MANIVVFTVHKAASMVLHDLLVQATAATGMNHYSPNLPDSPFFFPPSKKNCDEGSATYLGKLSGCIGPIRRPIRLANQDQYRIILHLRDPRDVLTSLYFSYCYSHVGFEERRREEWLKAGIDKFVLDRSDDFVERYDIYCQTLYGKPNVVFVTYEEMVGSFETWLKKFLDPFSLSVDDTFINNMVSRYRHEFSVLSEDITRHKRKVVPGDHREKLRPETIQALNQKFSRVFETLGYQTWNPGAETGG